MIKNWCKKKVDLGLSSQKERHHYRTDLWQIRPSEQYRNQKIYWHKSGWDK